MYSKRRGLGSYMVTDINTGQPIDCDSWSNMLNLSCWGFGAAIDATVGAPSTLTIPPPSVPGAPSSLPSDATEQQASDIVQGLTDQTVSSTQSAVSSANPVNTTPDCSSLLAPFTMPGCGSTFSLAEWLLIASGVAVGIVVLKGLVR